MNGKGPPGPPREADRAGAGGAVQRREALPSGPVLERCTPRVLDESERP
ncbi:hypothetical protein ACFQ71_27350 [Streptomyces sp. NPDC056534]